MRCSSALAGDPQGGGSPLVGGAGSIVASQPLLLPRSVPPASGEPTPPRLALEGNGKGGLNSSLPQAISIVPLPGEGTAKLNLCSGLALSFFRNEFSSELFCQSKAATRLASIRTLR